jgi:mono/diheme cytochrome c family protein
MSTMEKGLVMRTAILAAIVAAVLITQMPARAQAPATPQGDAGKGKTLFVERGCWQCHGLAAQGGGIAGPRLAGRVPAWPAFVRAVRRPTEEMVPYTEKMLPATELGDVYAWLKAIPPPPAVSSLPQLNRH